MPADFDPYHKWLGIRPEERPVHHYRLLGVQLYESDLDAIENAAYARMAHVRTFQMGPHSLVSQQLLNELATAKVCLLDPVRKAQYDQQLRMRTATPPPVTVAPQQYRQPQPGYYPPAAAMPQATQIGPYAGQPAAPVMVGSMMQPGLQPLDSDLQSAIRSRRFRRSQQSNAMIWLVLLVGGTLIGGVSWMVYRNLESDGFFSGRGRVAASDPAKRPVPAESAKHHETKTPTGASALAALLGHVQKSVSKGEFTRSDLAGGKSGDKFEELSESKVLIGLIYSFTPEGQEVVLQALQPVYQTAGSPSPGKPRGKRLGELKQMSAPTGYAVGKIRVSAETHVRGFQMIFMRITPTGLDPIDHNHSKWIGEGEGNVTHELGGDGRPIVGAFSALPTAG